MASAYVHGYDPRENLRLRDQASTLVELLHSDTVYPAGSSVLEAGCGVGAQTITLASNSPKALRALKHVLKPGGTITVIEGAQSRLRTKYPSDSAPLRPPASLRGTLPVAKWVGLREALRAGLGVRSLVLVSWRVISSPLPRGG
jgi:ubiquinone/menaquinone biosynthesis C-methylase UbiE